MANVRPYINHLLQNTGITPACSEEERLAAEDLAQIFRRHGFEPEVQEFTASGSQKIVTAVLGIVVFAGAVLMGVGGVVGVVGLLLVLAGAVLFVLERMGKISLASLGGAGLSQNVIAYHQASGPLASPRNRPVVVVAHYDSPRADILSQMPYASYRPVIVKTLPYAMVVPAVLAIVRLFPVPNAAKILLWIVAIVVALVPLVNAVATILNRFVLPYTSGAVCNKSSVAAMLGVMDAVAPFKGGREFPDDVPFGRYMRDQRRAAEQAARAAAEEAGVSPEPAEQAVPHKKKGTGRKGKAAAAAGGDAAVAGAAGVAAGAEAAGTGIEGAAATTEVAGGVAGAAADTTEMPPVEPQMAAADVEAPAGAEVAGAEGMAEEAYEVPEDNGVAGAEPVVETAAEDVGLEGTAVYDARAFAAADPGTTSADATVTMSADDLADAANAVAGAQAAVDEMVEATVDGVVADVSDAPAMDAEAAGTTGVNADATEVMAPVDAVESDAGEGGVVEEAAASDEVEMPDSFFTSEVTGSEAVALEDERTAAAPEPQQVNAVGNYRFGAETIRALGMLPETCEIEYDEPEPPAAPEPVDDEAASPVAPESAATQGTVATNADYDADSTAVVTIPESASEPVSTVAPASYDDDVDEDYDDAYGEDAYDDEDYDDAYEADEYDEDDDAEDDFAGGTLDEGGYDASAYEGYDENGQAYGTSGQGASSRSRLADGSIGETLSSVGARASRLFGRVRDRGRTALMSIEDAAHNVVDRLNGADEMREDVAESGSVFDQSSVAHAADANASGLDSTAEYGEARSDEATVESTMAYKPLTDDDLEGTVSTEVPSDDAGKTAASTPIAFKGDGETGIFAPLEVTDDAVNNLNGSAGRTAHDNAQADARARAGAPKGRESAADSKSVADSEPVTKPESSPNDEITAQVDAMMESLTSSQPSASASASADNVAQEVAESETDRAADDASPVGARQPATGTDGGEPESASVAEAEIPAGSEASAPTSESSASESVAADASASATPIGPGSTAPAAPLEPTVVFAQQSGGTSTDDESDSTVATPAQQPSTQQPSRMTETVDSLMAEINPPRQQASRPGAASRPAAASPVATSQAANRQQAQRRTPIVVPDPEQPSLNQPVSASRTSLFDLPDPSAPQVDPFAPQTPTGSLPVISNQSVQPSNQSTQPVSAEAIRSRTPNAIDPAASPVPGASAANNQAPSASASAFEVISADAPVVQQPQEDEKHQQEGEKRHGLGGLFHRKKQEEPSMGEYLGLGDDFDAKTSGRDIGSWENFENDEWKGGATGGPDVSEDELRDAVTSLGDDELLGHDIWFVATGASEYGNAGIKAFLNTHRDKLRGVFLINLECVGAGQLAMLSTEGDQRVLKGDKRITNLVRKVSGAFHHEFGAVDMPYLATDAYAAMNMSLRSLTIAGVDGPCLACSHSEEDLPINVDVDNINRVADVVTEVIRRS